MIKLIECTPGAGMIYQKAVLPCWCNCSVCGRLIFSLATSIFIPCGDWAYSIFCNSAFLSSTSRAYGRPDAVFAFNLVTCSQSVTNVSRGSK